jgi:8-oxo-dGTP diphosphatase
LVPDDSPRIAHLVDDWEVVKYTANIPHPFNREDAQAFIALMVDRAAARIGVGLGMERVVDGALIGCIGFGLEQDGTPELGFWVGREEWGRGYASEAAARLIRHLFEDLGMERVWASAHPDNAASRRVLAKIGMEPAGHERVALPARGQSVVMPVMALDRAAWTARHAARPHLLVVAAALVDGDGRVLVASRPPGKSMAGLWEFPGGKIGPGETPEQALVRELAEELGIDTGASCLAPVGFASHDYDSFHLLMPLYVLRQWEGQIQPREGQALRWVWPARLDALPMPPADIPLVALLRTYL